MGAITDLAPLVRTGNATFLAGFVQRHVQGRCGFHDHAGFEIVHHRRGRGQTILDDGVSVDFHPGDVVVYVPRQVHDQVQDSVGEDVCIQVMVAGALPRALPACFHLPVIEDAWIRGELDDLSQRSPPADPLERLSLALRAGALLVRLLALAQAAAEPRPVVGAGDGHAERAHRLIAEEFRTLGRLEEVAERLQIGYDHLRHVYRRRYGHSLVRRLMEVRVERAKTLLAHAPVPVAEVATEVGYATARHFSAVFKEIAGCTPGAWRESARGEDRVG
jgi:AraC-like DNA-binding protein